MNVLSPVSEHNIWCIIIMIKVIDLFPPLQITTSLVVSVSIKWDPALAYMTQELVSWSELETLMPPDLFPCKKVHSACLFLTTVMVESGLLSWSVAGRGWRA